MSYKEEVNTDVLHFETEQVRIQLSSTPSLQHGRLTAEERFGKLLSWISPILSQEFLIYEDTVGKRKVLRKIHANLVQDVSLNAVESFIVKHTDKCSVLTPRSVSSLAEGWLQRAPALKRLPPTFTMEPKELAFGRLSCSIKEMPTPLFDDLISRCGANGEAVKAYIWAIVSSELSLQQYLWLYGKGGEGKGSLIRLLERLMGSQSLVALSANDPHWPAMCVGKRIGVFNDLTNAAVQLSSTFKQITGGDTVTITQKHEVAYSARLNVQFIMSTNENIIMQNRFSDRRRIIYVELSSPTQKVKNYEAKLFEEAAGILFKCKEAFEREYDTDENYIRNNQEILEDKIEDNELEFEALFNTNFKYEPDTSLECWKVQRAISQKLKYSSDQGKFYDFLKQNYNIVKGTTRINGKKTNIFKDISLIIP